MMSKDGQGHKKEKRVVRVGLAAPCDMTAERDIAIKVIKNLNDEWGKNVLAPRLELISFRSSQKSPHKNIIPANAIKPVLIVTATKVESQAVLDVFAEAAGKKWTRKQKGNLTYYDLNIHGGAPVWMVQSEMGAATPGGALLTVRQAIQDIAPQAVIMCGIAFGLRPKAQALGELLIARQIEYYEAQKIDKHQGTLQRGDRVTASKRLLDRFRSADIDWKGAKTHFGLVMSGEKLVNDPGFRTWLREVEPEAIGGEMEVAGLYAAAGDARVDWIMVKAICDWGDGHKNGDAQEQAAKNAAQFVLHVLEQGGMNELSEVSASQTASASPISLDACELFIGIFGGKFGQSTDLVRSTTDGVETLVGTLQEMEEIFACSEKANQPFINLYRKREHFPATLAQDERHQVWLVNEFFQQHEKKGSQLVKNRDFQTIDEFRLMLSQDLEQIMKDMANKPNCESPASAKHPGVKRPRVTVHIGGDVTGTLTIGDDNTSQFSRDEKVQSPNGEKLGSGRLTNSPEREKPVDIPQRNPENSNENDPELNWLKEVGLRENPFYHQDAEERDKHLPNYFTRSTKLQWGTNTDLMSEKKIWFFGGDEGYGKTALRKFLAARGRPLKPEAEMICFEVNQGEFENLVAQLDEVSEFKNLFFGKMIEKCLHLFSGESQHKPLNWHSQGDLMKNIAILSDGLQERGVGWVLCLVDPSQESFAWKGSQVLTTSLLEPLINFPHLGSVRFRFFLPTNVKNELEKKFPSTVTNQHRYRQLQWDEVSLVNLLAKRMITLSMDQSAPLRFLGQVCEKELDHLVDAEIASLAQGSPRAAISLANRLVEVHCQVSRPTPLISLQEWEEVKSAWWSSGARETLGASKPQKLRVLEGRIFYRNHEIVLGGRSNQLLCCLALKEGFRSKDELIQAGWPSESPAGITEKALSEAVRRMKEELKLELNKHGVDGSEWIKSVRKRGYRLAYPEMAAMDQEDRQDE
jgi:nucleoside phosphorylase/DNA-binding winged helix-turn-helix (wHTH) protein